MKYIHTLLLSLLISYSVFGQNILESTGNVGIGTTNPTTKLEVAGEIKTYTTDENQYLSVYGGNTGNFIDSYGTNFHIRIDADNSKSITLKNSGEVGIGTTSPKMKLEVKDGDFGILGSNTSRYLRFTENAQNQGAYINYDGTNNVLNLGVHEAPSSDKASDKNVLSIVRNTGNVGIGTTEPSEKLEIKDGNLQIFGLNTSRFIRFSENGYQGSYINYDGTNNVLNLGVHEAANSDIASDKSVLSIVRNTGNVGIGTESPESKLHVLTNNVPNGHYLKSANIFENIESRLQILAEDTQNASAILFLSSAPSAGANKHWSFHHTGVLRNDRLEIGYGTSSESGDFWDTSSKMTISTAGDVGIGTTDTKGFKLGVNGKIAATEVKVALYDNWPDYVFENEYALPTLKEVENHITEKGHLKDIPSAADVAENGIMLGSMNAKLLQKIEELTLYTIAQEKSLAIQEEKIQKLKASKNLQDQKIDLLIKRLEALEAK